MQSDFFILGIDNQHVDCYSKDMKNLNGRELLKAELIWDRDHGQENEGWYLRTYWADGPSEDDVIPDIQDAPNDAPESHLRSAAILFLHDGMTDEGRAELRSMIEVRR